MERIQARPSDAAHQGAMPITPRAVLLGALSVALLALINPYLAFVTRTWTVGSGSLLTSPVVVLFALVLLNGALLRWLPGRAFTRGELLVVYGMLIVSIGLAMQGGIPYIVSGTTYPIYMASPTNDWEHLVWPYIPFWLRADSPEAVVWFWEGLPEGFGIPWRAWLTPLLAWSAFTIALMAAMFCLGALISRDWIERQRLAFPLVDVPLSMTGDQPRPSLKTSLLGNRIFWIGFTIPAFISVLGWLHGFYPSVPAPQLYDLRAGRYFTGMGLPWSVLGDLRISILFPVIGITCLLPAEVSLSLWFFFVLYRLQLLVWASFGVAEEAQTTLLVNPRTFIAFQEAGGFIALSAFLIYQSRNAIKAAWWSLLGRAREDRDPYAPLSGRWALLGFLLANGFMLAWALRAEMSWWAFAGLLGLFYAVLIGASRLVAAGGVMYVDTGFFPRWVIMRTVGARPLGPASLTLYSYLSVIYMYDPMNLAMPQMMDSFKLLHSGRLRGRLFPWAAALAVVAVLGVGLPALLKVVYHHGASALGRWPFTSYPSWAFNELNTTLHTPEIPDNWLRAALAIGAAVTLGLVYLNTTFVWWPLSPVGFLIASSYETNRSLWVNVFIAWALSGLIRRYGGLRLYRTLRPAFLGLVLGQYLTDGALAILSSALGTGQPVA
jgi:hypothetical protein